MRSHVLRQSGVAALVGVGALLSQLLLTFSIDGSPHAVAWPPLGLGLAVLLRMGLVALPAVFAGTTVGLLIVPTVSEGAAVFAVGSGTSTALSALVAALLVRRFVTVDEIFHDYRATIRFLGLAIAGQITGIVVLGSLLVLTGMRSAPEVAWASLPWFGSGVVGVFAFAPIVLVWPRRFDRTRIATILAALFHPWNLVFLAACGIALLVIFVFNDRILTFFVMPVFVAVSYRYPRRGNAILVPTLLFLTTWATGQGRGPFVHFARDSAFLQLGSFHVVLSATGLVLSAVLIARHDAERALAGSRQVLERTVSLLAATLESTTDGILVVDDARRIVASNERFRRMWGLAEGSSTIGDVSAVTTVREQLEAPDSFTAKIEELYATPEATSFDVLTLRDGRVFERFSQPQRIDDRIVGRVWSFRDVTERRRVEAARAELVQRVEQARTDAEFLAGASAILAGSLDPATTLETVARLAVPRFAEGCMVDMLEANGVARRVALAHTDSGRARGLRDLKETLPPEIAEHLPGAEAMRTGRPRLVSDALEEVRRLFGGPGNPQEQLLRSMEVGSMLATPLLVRGRVIGAFTFHSATVNRFGPGDVAFAEDLALRCALAIENAQLYAEAQRSVRVREDFMAIASHELRTPLTPLRMQLHLLRRLVRTEHAPDAPWREKIGSVLTVSERQLDRLVRLVETLLDTSRIAAGRLELERSETELRALVGETIADLEADLTRAGCAIVVHAPEPIIGRYDRLRLGQVFTNLLTNAVKYGRGAPIEVSLQATSGKATLRVRDHGPGIPEADQLRIFERFERSSSRQQVEGLGLGLYIAQQIVLLHGGSIRVDATVAGDGAAFVVELPHLRE